MIWLSYLMWAAVSVWSVWHIVDVSLRFTEMTSRSSARELWTHWVITSVTSTHLHSERPKGAWRFWKYFPYKSIFFKTFEWQMLIRRQTTNLLQIFCEIWLHSQVIFKSMKVADDISRGTLECESVNTYTLPDSCGNILISKYYFCKNIWLKVMCNGHAGLTIPCHVLFKYHSILWVVFRIVRPCVLYRGAWVNPHTAGG